MYAGCDEEILKYAADYRINLIAPGRMSDDELDEFQTNMREALQTAGNHTSHFSQALRNESLTRFPLQECHKPSSSYRGGIFWGWGMGRTVKPEGDVCGL